MEEQLRALAAMITLIFELVAVLIISVGGVVTLYKMILYGIQRQLRPHMRKVWLEFAGWILLGLEFMMASDIISTMVSPSWDTVGLLAAIVVIRTFLSFFIERDFEAARKISTEAS